MSKSQPTPYFLCKQENFVDSEERGITHTYPIKGIPGEGFIEFMGHDEVQIERPREVHAPKTGEARLVMVPESHPVHFPIKVRSNPNTPEGREKGLSKALAYYEEAKESYRAKLQNDLNERLKKVQAQLEAGRRITLPEGAHNPTLPERHLDKDGNETQGPGSIILP